MRVLHRFAAIRHIVRDLILRWFRVSYPVSALEAPDERYRDAATHDFRYCPQCRQFQRSVPCRSPAYLCPKCGATLYRRTENGCVWIERIGPFATRTRTFVLAAPLHDPFKSWAVVVCILASIAVGLFTPIPDMLSTAVLSWMDGRSSTWTYLFVISIALVTLMRATAILFRRRSTEYLFIPAYFTLAILILAIIVYGLSRMP